MWLAWCKRKLQLPCWKLLNALGIGYVRTHVVQIIQTAISLPYAHAGPQNI